MVEMKTNGNAGIFGRAWPGIDTGGGSRRMFWIIITPPFAVGWRLRFAALGSKDGEQRRRRGGGPITEPQTFISRNTREKPD